MLLLLLITLAGHDVSSAGAAWSDGTRAVSSMRPTVRRPVELCGWECTLSNRHAPERWTLENELMGLGGRGRSPAHRCASDPVASGLSWCGMVLSPAGLTFLVVDSRTGRTHPVRATLSRRGVRVTVRF